MSAKDLLINDKIKAIQIRLVDNQGEQLGIIDKKAALEMAYEKGLDLVEIAPAAKPPVCRIMDYGKFRFEKEKKEKESKKKQTTVELKEVKFSCRIDVHDFNTKINHAKKFLDAGNKVKITIVFSGREMNRTSMGYGFMDQVAQALIQEGTVEKRPMLEGRFMMMFIAPKTVKEKEKTEKGEAGENEQNQNA